MDVRKKRYSESDADYSAAQNVASTFARNSRSIGFWLNTSLETFREDPDPTTVPFLLYKDGMKTILKYFIHIETFI